MTKKEKQEILNIINNEGFEYTFIHYLSFSNVKDKKFHNLRENFMKARKDLVDYLGFEE